MSDYLIKARRAKNNEFYTEYKTLEHLFESPEYGEQFQSFVENKIIYLPCDTEDSNIYKYFVANQEKLKIKEILRTSDDYYKHLDLYEKCDLVFTNPPFTKLHKYAKWLDYDLNKKFVLWWSWQSVCFAIIKDLFSKHWKIICDARLWKGDKSVCCFIFTNIETAKPMNCGLNPTNTKVEDLPIIENIKDIEPQPSHSPHPLEQYLNVPYINRAKQFPINYYEPILIPPTVYLSRVDLFEFISWCAFVHNDGKLRRKVLVRLKRE